MSRRPNSSASLVFPDINKRPRRSRASIVFEENIDFTIGTTNADELSDKRTEESTKNNYKSKVRQMVAFFKVNAPECITDNDEIIVPLPVLKIKAFFGRLCQEALRRLKLANPDELNDEDAEVYSVSHVSTFRTAIVDIYRSHKISLESELDKELKNILDGYKKIINKLKQRGLMKLHEGKREISNAGYQLLGEKFVAKEPARNGGSWSTVTFAWPFYVLLWNLMCRSDSADKLTLNVISWECDALIIEEQGHKGDEKGENNIKKHIYANPYEPWICPILSMAVLVFSSGTRTVSREKVFNGTDSKKRFGDILRELVRSLSETEMQILACRPDEVGCHSTRKGSCTYCLGQVSGPTPVSVFLRMGQTLGQLKDRYVHHGEGADQLCGRMVCGLPFDSELFGTLPPHFIRVILDELDEQFWSNIVSGYDCYPLGFKTAFPYLLASLFYHESYLRSNMSANHPLFSSPVFARNSRLEILRKKDNIITGIGMCLSTGMRATGIPPHLAIARTLKELTESIESRFDELKSELEEMRTNLPATVCTLLSTELRENFVINGVAPFTIRDFDSRMTLIEASFRNTMNEILDSRRIPLNEATTHVPAVNHAGDMTETWWRQWDWRDGRLCHFVPPGWRFPSNVTLKAIYDLWHYGNRNEGIRPFKKLQLHVDIDDQDKGNRSKAKNTIECIENVIRGNGFIDDNCLLDDRTINLSNLAPVQSDAIFEAAYQKLLDGISGKVAVRRINELSYARVYQLICNHKKQQNQMLNVHVNEHVNEPEHDVILV